MGTSGSTSEPAPPEEAVGPVLARGPLTEAVLRALHEVHPDLTCLDRGAYVRVSVPGRCRLDRARVEHHTGAPFRLPGDLEAIMPSFKGRLRVSEDEVLWEAGGAPA